MKRFAFAVAAVALFAGVAGAREIQVSVAGQPQAVHQEIVRAAHDICFADAVSRMTLTERRARQTCVRQTVNDAIAAARSPALVAVHQGFDRQERFALVRQPNQPILAVRRAGGSGASAGTLDLGRTR